MNPYLMMMLGQMRGGGMGYGQPMQRQRGGWGSPNPYQSAFSQFMPPRQQGGGLSQFAPGGIGQQMQQAHSSPTSMRGDQYLAQQRGGQPMQRPTMQMQPMQQQRSYGGSLGGQAPPGYAQNMAAMQQQQMQSQMSPTSMRGDQYLAQRGGQQLGQMGQSQGYGQSPSGGDIFGQNSAWQQQQQAHSAPGSMRGDQFLAQGGRLR